MKETLNMPCPDPEGCKHFKAEMTLEERIAELEAQLEEEFSRGVKEGLNQAAEIVKNC